MTQEGMILLGRYRLEELAGRGAMSDVYRAYDLHRQAYVAVKLLREDLAEDPEFVRRLAMEAQTLAKLDHPNIVRLYSFERERHTAFLVLDYISGITLRRLLNDQGGPLPLGEVTPIFRQIVAALHYAHTQGIIHRDVKPGNILIRQDGHVFMSDFGIARVLENITMATMAVGTPAYMSPEQIIGKNIGPASDIYSLGVVLYEMTTGRRPFTGSERGLTGTSTLERVREAHLNLNPLDPRQWNPRLSPQATAVILKALAKSPVQRWPTVLDMLEAWEQATGVTVSPARPRVAPVPSFELMQMKERLNALYREGRWSKIIETSASMLQRWPEERDIVVLQHKARYMLNLEQELHKVLHQAQQTRRPEDWKTCLNIVQALGQEAPAVTRYRKLLERCQQEIVWSEASRRAEQLIVEEQLEEAESTLLAIPENYPHSQRLRQQIAEQRRRQELAKQLYLQAESYLANRAWDDAIKTANKGISIGGEPALFQPIIDRALEQKRIAEQVAGLLSQATAAAQQNDWDAAVEILKRAMELQPDNNKLQIHLSMVEEQRAWWQRLQQAQGLLRKYEWGQAESLLQGIPADFAHVSELLKDIEQCRQWQEAIEQAKQSDNPEHTLELLSAMPEDFPGRAGLYQAAQSVLISRSEFGQLGNAVRRAMDAGQWEEAISLCQKALALPDVPEIFRAWFEKAEKELAIDQQVDEMVSAAQKALDAQKYEEAVSYLENALALRPDRVELQKMLGSVLTASHQVKLLRLAQEAIREQKWQEACELLKDIADRDAEASRLLETAQEGWRASLLAELAEAESQQRWNYALGLFQKLEQNGFMTPALLDRQKQVLRASQIASLQAQVQEAIQQENWKGARKLVEQAYREFPEVEEFHRLRGEIWRHLPARPPTSFWPYVVGGAIALVAIIFVLTHAFPKSGSVPQTAPGLLATTPAKVIAIQPTSLSTPSPILPVTRTVRVSGTRTSISTPASLQSPTRTPTASKTPTRTRTLTPTYTATPRPTSTPIEAGMPSTFALLSPNPGDTFFGRDAKITLHWQAIKPSLASDEYYIAILAFPHGTATWFDYQWTQSDTVVLPNYLFDNVTGDRSFRWNVVLVRLQGGDPIGDPTGRVIEIAHSSYEWTFYWLSETAPGGGGGGGTGPAPSPTWTPRP